MSDVKTFSKNKKAERCVHTQKKNNAKENFTPISYKTVKKRWIKTVCKLV